MVATSDVSVHLFHTSPESPCYPCQEPNSWTPEQCQKRPLSVTVSIRERCNYTKDSAFTPPYRRTHARVGMVPLQNNEKPRPGWTGHMSAMWSGRGDTGTLDDWMSDSIRCMQPPLWWRWSHHLSIQRTQSSAQLTERCRPFRGQLHTIQRSSARRKRQQHST